MRGYINYLHALLHILIYPVRLLVVLFASVLHNPHYLFGVYGVAILVIFCIAPTAAEPEHLLYFLFMKNKNRKWNASNANTE